MKFLQPLIDQTRRLLTQPLGELNRWQLTARYAVGIARYGAHELKEDRASQMAAALTYRTIFSLIPLFVLGLLVFNSFGGFASVGGNLRETIYDYLGLSIIQIDEVKQGEATLDPDAPKDAAAAGEKAPAQTTTADPKDLDAKQFENAPPKEAEPDAADGETSDPEDPAADAKTQARVDQLLTDLQDQVADVNFTSIGLVGLALLIWAGLSLVVSLENCFNRVYHAPQGRPWHLRITIYWAVITLGPVLLALSFYMTNELVRSAGSVSGLGWLVGLLTPFASLAATWLLLLLIYTLLPNAKVQLRAALIGALSAAILWETSKWGFRLYVTKAVGYSTLYGSLGLVPLFLLWMYLTWLVILFGLEISYVVQTVKGTRYVRSKSKDDEGAGLVDSTAVLAVAATLGRAFDDGRGLDAGSIASDAGLSGRAAEALVAALHRAGVVHRLEGDEDGPGDVTLSRPAERIAVRDLLDAGRATSASADTDDTNDLVNQLRQAQQDAAADRTLRDLIGPAENHDDEHGEG